MNFKILVIWVAVYATKNGIIHYELSHKDDIIMMS